MAACMVYTYSTAMVKIGNFSILHTTPDELSFSPNSLIFADSERVRDRSVRAWRRFLLCFSTARETSTFEGCTYQSRKKLNRFCLCGSATQQPIVCFHAPDPHRTSTTCCSAHGLQVSAEVPVMATEGCEIRCRSLHWRQTGLMLRTSGEWWATEDPLDRGCVTEVGCSPTKGSDSTSDFALALTRFKFRVGTTGVNVPPNGRSSKGHWEFAPKGAGPSC